MRDRREEPCCVGHHVADHLAPPGDALALELRRGALVGAQEQGGEPIGLDPVVLFGHRGVEAPEAGLDVRERHPGGRTGAGGGRVRVAVDEHPVGPLALDDGPDRPRHGVDVGGTEVEPVRRRGDGELVEENLRHRWIPVLAGVQYRLVDARLPERHGERCRLDELWPVPDHGKHPHRR